MKWPKANAKPKPEEWIGLALLNFFGFLTGFHAIIVTLDTCIVIGMYI